jgi:hypothetical protein
LIRGRCVGVHERRQESGSKLRLLRVYLEPHP